jgi:hypothetical protein
MIGRVIGWKAAARNGLLTRCASTSIAAEQFQALRRHERLVFDWPSGAGRIESVENATAAGSRSR